MTSSLLVLSLHMLLLNTTKANSSDFWFQGTGFDSRHGPVRDGESNKWTSTVCAQENCISTIRIYKLDEL